ncbi:hypothetical protein BBK36DRAFT_1156879 [Trichoderma citrinoviride]|uniref:Cupin type-1 domain-containing protein n=1 Tax=Trichoderma citrinoviride TaxID=58853 RepID=A0A2T4BH29_9HYPO|nr:hypothetical protein BBK36DRAFT_1156879 [Trichoderma citrinoviride]PTB68626.1 hypothetical protein BBK36DRAFT_1156879 [Trichoderma citrinoviride]
MPDKVPTLVESGLLNGGKRSVIASELGPGSTTFPHYHKTFTETFHLHSGSLTIFAAPEGVKDADAMREANLPVGESAAIPQSTAHYFLAGEGGAAVTVTFEPAAVGFERTVLIMRGLQEDDEYRSWGVGANEENAMFVSVLSELTDSHPLTANDAEMIGKQDREGHEKLKGELIGRYATDDMLKEAVAKNAAAASA